MPRILFLTNAPTPYQFDLFDELARHHEVRVVHQGHALTNLDWQLAPRPWLVGLPRGRIAATAQLTMHMHRFRPDAVLIGGYSLRLSTTCRRLARALGADVSYWLEKPQPAPAWKAMARALVLGRRLQTVDRVFCIGHQAAAAYRPFARAVEVLPYAIDPRRYPPRHERVAGPVRFLFAGQLIERKGVRELLSAFDRLEPGTATLTIAGTGPLRDVVAASAARNGAVRPVGFVAPAAVPEMLATHDVFVLPSRFDGWAVVVVEAMACGLAVLGTRETGATADLITPGVSGAHVTLDPASLAAAMGRYVRQPELIASHGDAAREAFLVSRASAPNARAVLEGALGMRGI